MSETNKILVCCGTGCIANGALDVADALEREIADRGLAVDVELKVERTGCSGECEQGPVVRFMPCDRMHYKVKVKDVPAIVDSIGAEPVKKLMYKAADGTICEHMADNPFYAGQHKVVLEHVGVIDPLSLDAYKQVGGYAGLARALTMTPDEIISEVEASGLRGKGGAGFPTGRKWRTAAGYDNFPKYIVCNGDEGDPGAFMDGSIMEGCPHAVIEGMIIGAIATGAEEAILYIRDEYALARDHIQHAIDDAYAAGILGEHVMGSDYKLDMSIVRGGGAFVCGESTALMASIEGRVGEPRAKYIRSVQRGLFDQPTVLNNVETLASIPIILAKGGEAYAQIGTEKSKGTNANRHRKIQGYQGIRDGRQGSPYGSCRGSHGHDAAHAYLRYRRRHHRRPSVQGYPNRRSFGRLHSRVPARFASRFRYACSVRRDDGLGRYDRDGRPFVHGRSRSLLR